MRFCNFNLLKDFSPQFSLLFPGIIFLSFLEFYHQLFIFSYKKNSQVHIFFHLPPDFLIPL